jgi:hypothetical protein
VLELFDDTVDHRDELVVVGGGNRDRVLAGIVLCGRRPLVHTVGVADEVVWRGLGDLAGANPGVDTDTFFALRHGPPGTRLTRAEPGQLLTIPSAPVAPTASGHCTYHENR